MKSWGIEVEIYGILPKNRKENIARRQTFCRDYFSAFTAEAFHSSNGGGKKWVESNFSSKIKLISTYPALLALLYWHCETFSSRLFLLHFLSEFETLSEKIVAANVVSSSSVFLSAETFLSVDRRNSWNVKNGQRKKNANWKSDDGSRRKIKQIISTFTSVYTVECFSIKA